MEIIRSGDKILAIIYLESDWKPGLNFFTPETFFIQVGSWRYPKGKKLASHIHKTYERSALKTHEMAFVKKGAMKLLIYDDFKNKVGDRILRAGDLVVLAGGGHGYEILEEDTCVLEVKNGPFIDVEKDKEKFE